MNEARQAGRPAQADWNAQLEKQLFGHSMFETGYRTLHRLSTTPVQAASIVALPALVDLSDSAAERLSAIATALRSRTGANRYIDLESIVANVCKPVGAWLGHRTRSCQVPSHEQAHDHVLRQMEMLVACMGDPVPAPLLEACAPFFLNLRFSGPGRRDALTGKVVAMMGRVVPGNFRGTPLLPGRYWLLEAQDPRPAGENPEDGLLAQVEVQVCVWAETLGLAIDGLPMSLARVNKEHLDFEPEEGPGNVVVGRGRASVPGSFVPGGDACPLLAGICSPDMPEASSDRQPPCAVTNSRQFDGGLVPPAMR